MLVVKVGNLTEFLEEVPAYSNVRISSHEQIQSGDSVRFMTLGLDVMGFNELDELVWLHHRIELQLTPGSWGKPEPWTEQGKAIYAAYLGLVDLVQEYLNGYYFVRPGMYGIAQDIAPVGGELEIVRWDAGAKAFVQVEVGA